MEKMEKITISKEEKKMNKAKIDERYYIVRCDRAGVFFGHIANRDGREAQLTDCRRLWYWNGAASLSELAVSGVKYPEDCKFTVTVPEMRETLSARHGVDASCARVKRSVAPTIWMSSMSGTPAETSSVAPAA